MIVSTDVADVGHEGREVDMSGLRFRPRLRTAWVVAVAVLVVVVCAGATLAFGLSRPRVYGARVDILLQPRADVSDSAVERAMLTQEVILRSSAVLDPVARAAGTSVDALRDATEVEVVGRSNVLRVTVGNRRRAAAVRLTQAVADQYRRVAGSVRPPAAGAPTLELTALTGAEALDRPLQPKPVQALAAGVLVGLALAAGVTVALVRPRIATGYPRWG